MKLSFHLLLCHLLLFSVTAVARPPVTAHNLLPAGSVINIDIQTLGDATSTRLRYVVPQPKPVVVVPRTTDFVTGKLFDGLEIGRRGENRLTVRVWNNKTYVSENLPRGQILIRGPNLLLERSVTTAYARRIGEFAGGTTNWGGLGEPAGVVPPRNYRRKTFPDGAVYYELLTANVTPVTPPKPPVPLLSRSKPLSKLSERPFGYNRLSVKHPPYQDDWKYKQHTIAVVNAPGFPNETPDLLRRSGHNWFIADWFYGQHKGPWGWPKSTDKLYYEQTGAAWDPYRSPFGALSTDMTTIGRNLNRRLGGWNSVPENGKIDGVPTIKEVHFNIEYPWFNEDIWRSWSKQERNTQFINYSNNNRLETFQEVYNRGGWQAIDRALHQKWRNVIALSVQIINRHSKPARAFYGDWFGVAPWHDLVHWNQSYPPSDLLKADVNNSSLFPEANERANAGRLDLDGVVYDLGVNMRENERISNIYNYEWGVTMTRNDFNEYYALRGNNHDIRQWQSKMKPDLYRPYTRAFHTQLSKYIIKQKGWDGYRLYWQTENIYESKIFIEGGGEEGAWVSWTLDAQKPLRPVKLPLHAEVAKEITFHARMHLNGLMVWDSERRQNLPAGIVENAGVNAHQTGREGFQIALDEINQHDVFGPDTERHLGDVKVMNVENGAWVSGDASQYLFANGKRNGKPYKPVPLVSSVYRPSTGIELFSVYAVHDSRTAQSTVRFISPVDGAELTTTATGWGPTLYVRKIAR